ncbi:hypothetical protein BOQ23_13890 [Listeria monocytogenes]|nr:hypothetical protein [Listeria monocytogenes]
MEKSISWKTNFTTIILILSVVAFVFVILTENMYATYSFLTLLLVGFIFSAIGILSKREKKTLVLIIAFIIFVLAVCWISSILYLGLNGFYNN